LGVGQEESALGLILRLEVKAHQANFVFVVSLVVLFEASVRIAAHFPQPVGKTTALYAGQWLIHS